MPDKNKTTEKTRKKDATHAAVAAKVSKGLATVAKDTMPRNTIIKAVITASLDLGVSKVCKIHKGMIIIHVYKLTIQTRSFRAKNDGLSKSGIVRGEGLGSNRNKILLMLQILLLFRVHGEITMDRVPIFDALQVLSDGFGYFFSSDSCNTKDSKGEN